jgi:polysaccharide export outer membrane protein
MLRHAIRLAFLSSLAVPSAAAAQAPDLPLRDGDRVLVKIWSDTLFADSARVQHGVSVVLPRVGSVPFGGVPASRIADSVRSVYSRLFRSLSVEVSPLRKVTVIGEVRRPSVFYLDPEATIGDAVAMAGGVTDIGKSRRLTRIHDSSVRKVSDWQTLRGNDAFVRSGEVLLVEREPWVKRNAFAVVSGISVLLSIGLTLAQL